MRATGHASLAALKAECRGARPTLRRPLAEPLNARRLAPGRETRSARCPPKDGQPDRYSERHHNASTDGAIHWDRRGRAFARLTFGMSGGWRQAKLAGRRPLDVGVSRYPVQ